MMVAITSVEVVKRNLTSDDVTVDHVYTVS
jgi:hypothetical protein